MQPDLDQIERSRATEPTWLAHPPKVPGAPLIAPLDLAPFPYQIAGVEYALDRDDCLIGDEPGLGKTAQAIMISNAIGAEKTLVVCPASLRLNWQREIWHWSTIFNVSAHVQVTGKQGVSPSAHYIIVSYDLLRNKGVYNAIMATPGGFDHLIIDEAHALKDPKGNERTKILCDPDRLPAICGRITLLSGTPSPNQPIELYNAIRLLNWNAIDLWSLDSFRDFYYEEGEGWIRGYVWDEAKKARVNKLHFSNKVRNKPRRLDNLQAKLRSTIMVRRKKEHVLTQLPRKQFHLVPLATTAEMRAALRHPGWAQAEQLYDIDPDAFEGSVMPDGEIATARRLLGESKVGPSLVYIKELLEEGREKLVISAHHTSVLKAAKEGLSHLGLVYMDGSTSTDNRQRAVDKFMNDPEIRIILGQTQVIGEGHTLTAAQDVVLLEPDWTPGRITQMVDRIHRIGQKGDYVMAHLPIVPDSLDERIVSAAVAKDRDIYQTLDAISGK